MMLFFTKQSIRFIQYLNEQEQETQETTNIQTNENEMVDGIGEE